MSAKKSILIFTTASEQPALPHLRLSTEYSVKTVFNPEEAIRAVIQGVFSLVVVDCGSSYRPGLELIRRVRVELGKGHAELPILFVTGGESTITSVLALECGADDCILRPCEPPVFIARVRALLRRAAIGSLPESGDSLLEVGQLKADFSSHRVWISGDERVLSKSEMRLLKTLARSRGRAFSRNALMDAVLEGKDVTSRAIDTHVFTLRDKLGACGDMIQTVRGIGYRFELTGEEGRVR